MVSLLLALGVFVDFLVAATMPSRAERFRQWAGPWLKRIENRADQAPGLWGGILKGPFWASRKSLDFTTDAGEKVHEEAE